MSHKEGQLNEEIEIASSYHRLKFRQRIDTGHVQETRQKMFTGIT